MLCILNAADLSDGRYIDSQTLRALLTKDTVVDFFDEKGHRRSFCCLGTPVKLLRARWLMQQLQTPNNTPSGLKWCEVGAMKPRKGLELTNSKLAEALQDKTEFTEEEWFHFGVSSLKITHCIRSGGSYFQPAATPYRLPTRQAIEAADPGAFVSGSRITQLLDELDEVGCSLLNESSRNNMMFPGIVACSYIWLTPEHPECVSSLALTVGCLHSCF